MDEVTKAAKRSSVEAYVLSASLLIGSAMRLADECDDQEVKSRLLEAAGALLDARRAAATTKGPNDAAR